MMKQQWLPFIKRTRRPNLSSKKPTYKSQNRERSNKAKMPYNINKLMDRYAVMTGQKKAGGGERKGPPFQQWKPTLDEAGKARTLNVRFLPYLDKNEQPVQEILYYNNDNLAPYRLVAPVQFGMKDPINEYITSLGYPKTEELKKVRKSLLPRSRFFVPVLVREEQEKGVQVWELSPNQCKDFYAILSSEDYRDEDVVDPLKGRDFQVSVSPSGKTFKAPNGKEYPVNDTKILIRGKQSKLAPDQKTIDALVSSVPNLEEIFMKQVKSYDELKEILDGFLSLGGKPGNSPPESNGTSHHSSEMEDTEEDIMKSIEDKFDAI